MTIFPPMLCERCQEEEASIHLTQVAEGQVRKLHLCEACAEESGVPIAGAMSVPDMLAGMGGSAGAGETGAPERTCPQCHMGRSDFKKTNRFGCPACYDAFADELAPLLHALHQSEQHRGKVPRRESLRFRMSAELRALRLDLEAAVAAQRFEDAARLRGEIESREILGGVMEQRSAG